MKNTLVVLISLLVVSLHTHGQRSASSVMRVSAKVVSGVTITNSSPLQLNLSNNSVSRGKITLKTPEHEAINTSVSRFIEVKNELGDSISITSEVSVERDKGITILDVTAFQDQPVDTTRQGLFTGTMIASVEYY